MKNRRDFLKLSGVAGVVALMPWNKIIASGEANTCILTPNEVEGPYPYPGGELTNPLQIIDIRNGEPGIQLDLIFTVVDAASCIPLPNVRVDIWHCNKDGDYSGYGNFVGQTFLRGYQFSDANGQVQFTTIYPGWYPGRATHIHMEVFYNGVMKKTAQLAFDETISNVVHVTAPYTTGINPTTNMGDGIFNNSAADLANETAVVTGNTTSGYTGTYTIGINGVSVIVSPEKSLQKISIYPNPVSDKLIVSHPVANANTSVKVLSPNGKAISSGLLKSGATITNIDVSWLANGMYILVIENNGQKLELKFVKK